jgi:glycosyltransferase involved in cell wall biosynthesis
VDELRDPRPFMLALKKVFETTSGMQVVIEFIGNVNSAFKDYVSKDTILSKITRFTNTVPHKELLQLYGETDLLLLVLAHTTIAPGNLPGKLFEYLASGVPVVAIGPVEGDAAHVLRDSKAGEIFSRDSGAAIGEVVRTHYEMWTRGEVVQTQSAYSYSRENLTKKLIGLLESI